MHDAIPDVASDPAKLTVNGFRYQPPVGARSAFALTDGGVASYFRPRVATALVLPALSTQVAPVVADALSGPPYDDPEHEATPEVASVPVAPTSTAWLYQPFESGPRAAATLADGGVASYLNPNAPGALTLPATSVHVPATETEAPSPPAYVGVVQDAIPETASRACEGDRDGAVVPAVRVGSAAGWLRTPSAPVLSIRTVTLSETV